jgi:hypothetical protein
MTKSSIDTQKQKKEERRCAFSIMLQESIDPF